MTNLLDKRFSISRVNWACCFFIKLFNLSFSSFLLQSLSTKSQRENSLNVELLYYSNHISAQVVVAFRSFTRHFSERRLSNFSAVDLWILTSSRLRKIVARVGSGCSIRNFSAHLTFGEETNLKSFYGSKGIFQGKYWIMVRVTLNKNLFFLSETVNVSSTFRLLIHKNFAYKSSTSFEQKVFRLGVC